MIRLKLYMKVKRTADMVYPSCSWISSLILAISSAEIDNATSCQVHVTSSSIGRVSPSSFSSVGCKGTSSPSLFQSMGGGGGNGLSRP